MANELDMARQDLAFMRGLVEDSRPLLRPLGAALVIGGVVHGLSFMRLWAVAQGLIGWPQALRPFMGVDGLVVQIAVIVVYALANPSMKLPRATASPAGRAVRGAINALAWALGAAVAGLVIASGRLHRGELMTIGFPIVLFALTSATWQLMFAVYRRAWALWAAIACALLAVAMGLAGGTPAAALVIAAGFVACLAAPGLCMMRQSRQA